MSYDPCEDDTSLGCSTVNSECNENADCFPECCGDKKFDFTNKKTIDVSEASDCFQIAPELISEKNDNLNLLGHYIYHRTGADPDKRASCKKVNGIIYPKCCNAYVAYDVEDPCHCFGANVQTQRCSKVHHEQCFPKTNGDSLSGAFPQCCYDIGDFFGYSLNNIEFYEKNVISVLAMPAIVDSKKISQEKPQLAMNHRFQQLLTSFKLALTLVRMPAKRLFLTSHLFVKNRFLRFNMSS